MRPSLGNSDKPVAGNIFRRLLEAIRERLRAFNRKAAMLQEAKELAARNNTLARNRDFCKG